MTTSQTGDDCQTNDPNKWYPIESLRFPLDSSMRIVFTGYYNGSCVEVRSADEMALLYHMGCFGKGSISRSRPKTTHGDRSPTIIRKRQFLKRNYWYKKFCGTLEKLVTDTFFKDVDDLCAKIVLDGESRKKRDVIDLVSSDEEVSEESESLVNDTNNLQSADEGDVVVIVPNSDSEDENYFANMKPKCCINRIRMQEKLILTLQEAFFLFYGLGCLQIIDLDEKMLNTQQCWDLFTQTDKNFILKYVVYHYFRSKGYIVKSGIKFGGDYLLYKEGPGITHADYIVLIKTDEFEDEWIAILGHVRMAATTVKEILLAEVYAPETYPNHPEKLNMFSVREILLSRKLPVSINCDPKTNN